ncbi:hypothetical protein PAHAL_3G420000 [Panicum hallii]|uniref:Uncharacterized protein n=1 Tax=Panicum hallii TaxID=206008 RepID=A0A2T8KL56_9POAL|nr:hypothetical protein PAHAL_3G420000 [Panicum hallii]
MHPMLQFAMLLESKGVVPGEAGGHGTMYEPSGAPARTPPAKLRPARCQAAPRLNDTRLDSSTADLDLSIANLNSSTTDSIRAAMTAAPRSAVVAAASTSRRP